MPSQEIDERLGAGWGRDHVWQLEGLEDVVGDGFAAAAVAAAHDGRRVMKRQYGRCQQR